MTIKNLRGYKNFVKVCRFFNCDSLFEGDWPGQEQYIITSDFSEKELRKTYPEIMDALSPVLCLPAKFEAAYAESWRNTDKHNKRLKQNTLTLSVAPETEHIFSEQASESPENILEELENRYKAIRDIRKTFEQLTTIQQRRAKLHYIDRLSIAEIANLENVSKKAVHCSLISVEKIFNKVFKTYYTNSTPYSLHSRGVNKNEGDDGNE